MTRDFYDWCLSAVKRYEDATGAHLYICEDNCEDRHGFIVEIIAGTYDEVICNLDSEEEVKLAINMMIKQARLDKIIRG